MEKQQQIALAERFRALHHGASPLLLANAWDALSARIVEECGYEAIATTSGGLNWTLGYPDGEAAPWPEVVAATGRIARVLRVPLSADIEAGYGATPADVTKTVTDIVAAGAVGINLEDSTRNSFKPLRIIEDMVARIRAARSSARELGIPIFINARVDVYHKQTGDPGPRFAETVQRAEAYLSAGADCIFPFGLTDLDTIGRLTKAIDAPINVVGRPGMPKVQELARLGVRRVSIASSLTMMTIEGIQQVARKLRQDGSFDMFNYDTKRADIQRLFEGGHS
jgi:2-methylisocitrate lyase-like PEP mutase family enzyme